VDSASSVASVVPLHAAQSRERKTEFVHRQGFTLFQNNSLLLRGADFELALLVRGSALVMTGDEAEMRRERMSKPAGIAQCRRDWTLIFSSEIRI
jgi:hypothetical protein